MRKFEYKIHYFSLCYLSSLATAQKELNELGCDGWYVIGTVSIDNYVVWTLEREIEQD